MSCLGCLNRMKKMKNLSAHEELINLFRNLTSIEINQERDIFVCEDCEIRLIESCQFKRDCQTNYENLIVHHSGCQPQILKDECKKEIITAAAVPAASLEAIYVQDTPIPTTTISHHIESKLDYDEQDLVEQDTYCDDSDLEPGSEPEEDTNKDDKTPQLVLNYETGKMEVLKKRKLKGLEPETRKSYTAKTKIEIVQYAELKGNREASRLFKINESSIRGWRKQKDKLLLMESNRKTFRKGSPYWPDLEKDLKTWVEQERNAGKTITSFHIKIEALRMARERNINNFSGTKKWCYSFMRRNSIAARTRKKRNSLPIT